MTTKNSLILTTIPLLITLSACAQNEGESSYASEPIALPQQKAIGGQKYLSAAEKLINTMQAQCPLQPGEIIGDQFDNYENLVHAGLTFIIRDCETDEKVSAVLERFTTLFSCELKSKPTEDLAELYSQTLTEFQCPKNSLNLKQISEKIVSYSEEDGIIIKTIE